MEITRAQRCSPPSSPGRPYCRQKRQRLWDCLLIIVRLEYMSRCVLFRFVRGLHSKIYGFDIAYCRPLRYFSGLGRATEAAVSYGPLRPTINDILRGPIMSTSTVHGWVRSIRLHKNVAFAMIYDGSTGEDLQIVLQPADAQKLQVGCAVQLVGSIVSSKGSQQAKELVVDRLEIKGYCPNDSYPIQNKEMTVEFLRSVAHLRPRTSHFATILRLRHQLARSLRSVLSNHQFTEIHAPSIVFSDCEGLAIHSRSQKVTRFFWKDC